MWVLITHKLQKLDSPIPLQLDIPEAAKSFQFQGDFVFFFIPYPGTWASNHYEKVIVHRFDVEKQVHKFIGEYSLANHYCNCVAGAGHLILALRRGSRSNYLGLFEDSQKHGEGI